MPEQDTAVSLIIWGNLGMSWSLGPGLGVRENGREAEMERKEMDVGDRWRKSGHWSCLPSIAAS